MTYKMVLSTGAYLPEGGHTNCIGHIPFETDSPLRAKNEFRTALEEAQQNNEKTFKFLGNTLSTAKFINGWVMLEIEGWFRIYQMKEITG